MRFTLSMHISLILSRTLVMTVLIVLIRISLAAWVLTWNSPQLTSSFASLWIIVFALAYSLSLPAIYSRSKYITLWVILLPLLSVGKNFSQISLADFSIIYEKVLKSYRIFCGFSNDFLIIAMTSLVGFCSTGSSWATGKDATASIFSSGSKSFSTLLKVSENLWRISNGIVKLSSIVYRLGSKTIISSTYS
jgi:hypothetical protein